MYRKRYRMRSQGEDGLNTVVSIPPAVIEAEAEKHNLTIEEFINKFVVVAQYNGIEGILYTFEERVIAEDKGKIKKRKVTKNGDRDS